MRDVEPQRGAERMLLVLGGEHALGDVSAAARLGSRIPARPPIEVSSTRKPRKNGDAEDGMNASVSRACPLTACVASKARRARPWPHSADGVHGEVRQQDDHAHLEDELQEVRHSTAHRPETALYAR